jgi:MFS family permease
MLSLTRYQWTVLLAAWLGWGFDVFDALLFNYVAPNCVPTLLGLELGSAAAKQATLYWTGLLTSLLLIGWASGGVLFGMIADRIGRTRTLMLTMLLTHWWPLFRRAEHPLAAFRLIASLGIGGSGRPARPWSRGRPSASRPSVAHTAAPLGLFLAFVNRQVGTV